MLFTVNGIILLTNTRRTASEKCLLIKQKDIDYDFKRKRQTFACNASRVII